MKNYFYTILLTLLFFSCKPTIKAQEKKEIKPKKQKIAKPKFGDLVDEKIISPNIIKLQVIILEEMKPNNVCGSAYSNTLKVKVNKILSSGSSITNAIIKDKNYTFILNNLAQEKVTTKIKLGKKISLTIKEGLCKKENQSLYEIIGF